MRYLLLYAIEGTSADKQYVVRVHVYVFLVRVLSSSLWRHVHHGAFQELQQSLLYALAAHIACDAWVVALSCYLVNFIDEHYSFLGCLNVVVGYLQQSGEDALYVLAHIAGLSEHCCVDDGERYVKHLGDGSCQQGFSSTCRANHDDIALLDLHTVVILWLLQALIVVVDSHGKILLRFVLSYDILVEVFLYLFRLWHLHILCVIVLWLDVFVEDPCLLGDVPSLPETVLADVAV